MVKLRSNTFLSILSVWHNDVKVYLSNFQWLVALSFKADCCPVFLLSYDFDDNIISLASMMRLFDSRWRYLYLMMYNISAYLFVLFSVFSQNILLCNRFYIFFPDCKRKEWLCFSSVWNVTMSLAHPRV